LGEEAIGGFSVGVSGVAPGTDGVITLAFALVEDAPASLPAGKAGNTAVTGAGER
jgi:hypothetical protein